MCGGNVGIDGQAGMKLTFGIIVVEGKDNQEKVAKVKIIYMVSPFDLLNIISHSC